MKTDGIYVPEDSIYPLKGLNDLSPSVVTDPHFSPVFENLLPDKGLATKRPGYVSYGTGLPLNGVPLKFITFEPVAGTEYLVVLTTTKQYYYNSGTGAWTNITYQVTGSDVNWTGAETDVIHATVASGTGGTWLIITNGKDKPRYWTGSGKFDLLENAAGWSYTGFVTCKDVVMFYNHLVMVNITKASAYPGLIGWTDFNSLVDFGTGTSGEILTTDLNGPIEACLPLGDRLVIYGKDSIGVLTYVGGDVIFTYETLVQDTRLTSGRGIINLGPYHFLMRKENIAGFDGTRAVRDIGDNIYRGYKSRFNGDLRLRSFAFLDRASNRIYFAIPVNSTTTIFYLAEYGTFDIANITWSRLSFPVRITTMGLLTRNDDLKWDSSIISGRSWTSMNQTWDSATSIKGFPVMMLADSSGNVYIVDGSAVTDNGTAIIAEWQSADFSATQGQFQSIISRWFEIELDLIGRSVEVSYSVDQGSNWTVTTTLTLQSDWKQYKVPILVSGRTIRIRLKSSDVGFTIRWVRVWGTPISAW